MSLIDEFGGDDARSMAANNTSAFNCRTTDRGAMSRHAYGMAVDINPVQNPYREGQLTEPEAGRAYDEPYKRRRDIVGIIVDGGGRDQGLRATRLALGWTLEAKRRLSALFQ